MKWPKLLFAALAVLGGPAVAQPLAWDPYGPYGPAPYPPVYDLPPAVYGYSPIVYCRRWCPADLGPCDPPHYKIADGRCAGTSRDR
jgi:hypothetical protein